MADRLTDDALFGPDGTQLPTPPPMLTDPLAGFAEGAVLAGDDPLAVDWYTRLVTSPSGGRAAELPKRDELLPPQVAARRAPASIAASVRPRVGQPRMAQPQVIQAPESHRPKAVRAASPGPGRPGGPASQRRGKAGGWIVALLIIAVFTVLRAFGGELSALFARLFHTG